MCNKIRDFIGRSVVVVFLNKGEIKILSVREDFLQSNQLPRLPPVFTGFFPAPAVLFVGLAMNLEPPPAPFFGVLLLLSFLLLVGNDIIRVRFIKMKILVYLQM